MHAQISYDKTSFNQAYTYVMPIFIFYNMNQGWIYM